MPEYTANYELYKPSRDDEVVVDESLTSNFETIDTEIKNRQDDIATNADNISGLQDTTSGHGDNINELQDNVTSNANDISSLQDSVSGHADDISTLQTNVSNNDNDISTLQDNVSGHADDINNLQTSVAETESSINTLNENVGTMSELTTEDNSSLVSAINEVNVEVNKGVFTTSGDDESETVEIPHELSDTPVFYQAQEASVDAGTADISHVTADATSITVTFKTAPVSGTDNVSLVWRAEL